jgi:intracellular sulfur oxidation DsrE/DsrF family protein
MKQKLLTLLLCCYFFQITSAQQTGPIIENFGQVYAVPTPDFPTDTAKVYKVIFDIHGSPDKADQINPQLNTLARFLNMHAQAGVPAKNLHVACVFHNKATWNAANNEQYHEKYGVDNPNIGLMKALEKAGAELYICGQSVYARGLDRERLAEPVKVGLSAMTVILSYTQEGYQLIKF